VAESSLGDGFNQVVAEIPLTLSPGSGPQSTGFFIPYGATVLDFSVRNADEIDVPASGGGKLNGWILRTGGGNYTQIQAPASNADPIPQFTRAYWPTHAIVTPTGPIHILDPSDNPNGALVAVGVSNFGASGGESVVAYVLYQVATR
jgi:hypothetical protein